MCSPGPILHRRLKEPVTAVDLIHDKAGLRHGNVSDRGVRGRCQCIPGCQDLYVVYVPGPPIWTAYALVEKDEHGIGPPRLTRDCKSLVTRLHEKYGKGTCNPRQLAGFRFDSSFCQSVGAVLTGMSCCAKQAQSNCTNCECTRYSVPLCAGDSALGFLRMCTTVPPSSKRTSSINVRIRKIPRP